MRTEFFDYELPPELIAQRPLAERDGGRLLVVDSAGVQHRTIRDLPDLVARGALVVVNDTRVRRCRVIGRRARSGGKVELLMIQRLRSTGAGEVWECLGKASKPLKPGQKVDAGPLHFEVLGRTADGALECLVSSERSSIEEALESIGHVPIPPYMARDDDADDVSRYQTVFAREIGSAAAPTAGLHLTPALIQQLQQAGAELEYLTLHVGLGTFKPVTADDLDQHVMHIERYSVSAALAGAIARARERAAPVVAVGTTVVRALESAADRERPGYVVAGNDRETRLLIQPGYRFQIVDSLLTNFHAPKSTLLALVSAFAGRERIMHAYAAAIAQRYRFLSYGDAMWLPSRLS